MNCLSLVNSQSKFCFSIFYEFETEHTDVDPEFTFLNHESEFVQISSDLSVVLDIAL